MEGIQPLCDALVLNRTLEHLHLGQNRLGDAVGLAHALGAQGCPLLELHITRCGIGPRGVEALATAVATNTVLRELHLGNNRAGDRGAIAMATALQRNRRLAALGLASNVIGDAGAVALAEDSAAPLCSTSLPPAPDVSSNSPYFFFPPNLSYFPPNLP